METTIEQEKTLDKSAIRDFAVNARRKLKEKVELQANKMGFYSDGRAVQYEFEDDYQVKINGEFYPKAQIKILKEKFSKNFDSVIDEVAYTWFNRFIALYYMECHNYIENGLNIISSIDDLNQTAIKAPNYFKNINKEELFASVQANDSDVVYKKLIIAQCNELNKKLPFLFEEISNYTELLFPSGMLNNDSIIREMLALDKKNWEEVEIIGWLYQYYNQTEKDRVIQAKKRYKTNEIPFATQLFTPKWIVKYMTQNSLGRLWQEANPNSKLKESMEFYLEPRSLTDEDKKELEQHIMKSIMPEQIKVYDPACGSGHVLVYAYSLLYKIYQEAGYIEEEIPSLILKNNLFGLDICKRAAQLAQLAVIFKAKEDDKNIFDKYEELNIRYIEKSQEFSNEEIAFVAGADNGESFENIKDLIDAFQYADIYGSLCKLPNASYEFYKEKLEELKNKPSLSILVNSSIIYNKFEPLVKQLKIMKQQYECVITNPPYMGNKYMEPKLAEFVQKYYPSNKSDLFSAFMEYIPLKNVKNGHIGLVTPFVWMFIKSYEELRNQIINSNTLSSIIQLEYNAFEAACVPVATFTLRNNHISYPAECIKLSDFTGAENQPLKTLEAIQNPAVNYRFTTYSKDFHSIPGSPIAYWASDRVREIFAIKRPLSAVANPCVGLQTADNGRFIRFWNEVDISKIGFGYKNSEEAKRSCLKWFPYNKGGAYRKWYGNQEFVVNWEFDGAEIRNFDGSVVRNPNTYFNQSVSWSKISSSDISLRYFPYGFLYDVAGCSMFNEDESILKYMLGFTNSKIVKIMIKSISPTLNYEVGQIASLPVSVTENKELFNRILNIIEKNIQISKDDWDSFETSWDFEQHPLIRFRQSCHPEFISGSNQQEIPKQIQNDSCKVSDCFSKWKEYKQKQFNKLKSNEEELNRLFIEIYGLQDEMTPEVADKDITVALADELREVKSLLSYAVGCIFGRYSLDEKGLIFAGGEFDSSKYKTLEVDEDAILPILGDTWFDDDIIEEFKRFLKASFGELYFNENMQYIADVLGRKGGESAEDKIRNYFLKDFYKDHLQIYKKRPIYWMFSSGKEKAFNCLVYLHRYDKTTLSRIRKDYLHEFQAKLDRAISQAEEEGNVKLTSLYAKYKKESQDFDAKIKDLADAQIELNLDDGVKVNYAKFKGLLEMEKNIIGKLDE